MERSIHFDFQKHLECKDESLQELFKALRDLIINIYPEGNELLYKTHALTSVYSTSSKLTDAYCHIPIYNEHLDLGFNYGRLLDDPLQLLRGTGKLIRHIPITDLKDFQNDGIKMLIADAVAYSITHRKMESQDKCKTISKIKN